jgi:hypothetical protein
VNEKDAVRKYLSQLGKKGGQKGGKGRMAGMTAAQRKALAKKAAAALWSKKAK